MVFRWRSTQTVEVFLLQDFGKVYRMLWELISPSVLPSIRNQVVKWNESIKFWKTCFEPLSSLSVWNGKSVFHLPNSLITIVIKPAWAKLLSKFYRDEGVEHLLTGQRPGKDNSLARI